MVGEDLSSSELAAPPRPALHLAARAGDLEREMQDATADMGLSRWFWGEGVCHLARVRLAYARGQWPPPETVGYVDAHASAPPVVEHVNNLAPGAVLAELFRRDSRPEYRALLESMIAWYHEVPTRDGDGAVEHWPGGVWADTVYMAGEFLLRAGAALDRPELMAEARRQWLAHARALQDPRSGLVAHGTHMGVRVPCHWGRANAWFALAGVDLVAAGADDDAEVRERLLLQLGSLIALQPPHGVWDVLVDSPAEVRGILETSAAAGLGAALLRMSDLMEEDASRDGSRRSGSGRPSAHFEAPSSDLREAGMRAIEGALAYVDGGFLTRVSAGTVLQLIPFGYSVIRDDRPQPWGQGLALEALAAWRESVSHSTQGKTNADQ